MRRRTGATVVSMVGRERAPVELTTDEKREQQHQLIERHQHELIALRDQHRDQLAALQLHQQGELHQLEARQLRQLGALWRAQGRQLGPGLERAIEGSADR